MMPEVIRFHKQQRCTSLRRSSVSISVRMTATIILRKHITAVVSYKVTMDNSKAEYAISIFADPTNIKEMTKGRILANRSRTMY